MRHSEDNLEPELTYTWDWDPSLEFTSYATQGRSFLFSRPNLSLPKRKGIEQNVFSCKEEKTKLKTAETIKSLIMRGGREEGPGGLYRLQAAVKHAGSFCLSALPVSAQNTCATSSPESQT